MVGGDNDTNCAEMVWLQKRETANWSDLMLDSQLVLSRNANLASDWRRETTCRLIENAKLNKNADIIAAAKLLIFPTKKMLLI